MKTLFLMAILSLTLSNNQNLITMFKTIFFILLLSSSAIAQQRGYILCNIESDRVSKYVNSIWSDCEEISKANNIPLALIIAQCCLESGFGKSEFAKERNNHLGIKYNGTYATFSSFKECLNAYARIFEQSCYKDLQPGTLLEWIDSLTYPCCSYATSPKYAKKLIYIIKKYNLDVIPLTH